MTSTPNLVALQDIDQHSAGAIVWWRLREHTSLERLSSEWGLAGHDPDMLPARTTQLAALKRAMADLHGTRRLVRPLEQREGYALVDETARGDDLQYDILCTAKIHPSDVLAIEPPFSAIARSLQGRYERKRVEISRNMIGSWLTDLLRHCHAVSLRPSGGIYFIPKGNVARFRAWVDTFMAASDSVVFEVPALKSDEAVAAILDAVTRESGETLQGIADEIGEATLGKVALQTREAQCEALGVKLQAYAELLGPALARIEARLDDTKASVVEAILMADTADEETAVRGLV